MYAVLETGSKQYRVSAGDTVQIERLPVEAGQSITFDRVLLVSHDGQVAVGSPTVADSSIVGDVVGHIRGEKKTTFKMKRRKGYHKTIGHRQELTVVKIKAIKSPLGISAPAPASAAAPPAPVTETTAPVTETTAPVTETPSPATP